MPRNVLPESIRFFLAIAACLSCTFTLAQDNSDADTREVLAYTLTEAGLGKYTQATRNLAALRDGMPGACDEDTDGSSIAKMVAALNAMPGAQSAIRSAGMATREYVVFTWSLLHNALAGWADSQPGGSLPAGASQANVDFLKQHESDLRQLNASQAGDDCGEEDYDEDYD